MAARPVGSRRDVQITVRGDRAVVRVTGATPIAVRIDSSLRAGGIQFRVAAQGQHTVLFEAPTMTPREAGP